MTALISFTGNATGDAELKFGASGTPFANVTIAVTPREKQPDGSYADGDAAFYRVTAFKRLAENVAESVHRGDRVTVVGRIKPREYEHNGEKRISLDVVADSIALDLMFATATANRANRQQAPERTYQPGPGGPRQEADPWQQPQNTPAGWGQPAADPNNPPF
ncbi:MAG: single-stranded DNA-binding protein [Propionibacteriaceae bacterium]|nr:single-stranded DNA-binding protein [Propionibacteriaceae bacterium]